MKKLVSFVKNLQSGFCGFLQGRLIKVWIPSRGVGRIKELVSSFKWWETSNWLAQQQTYTRKRFLLCYLYSNNNDTVHSYSMHQLRMAKCLGACWAYLCLKCTIGEIHNSCFAQGLAGNVEDIHITSFLNGDWSICQRWCFVQSRERLGTWVLLFVSYLSWPS